MTEQSAVDLAAICKRAKQLGRRIPIDVAVALVTRDRSDDVFALGSILWECLTGVLVPRKLVPPSSLRSEIPREVDLIVLRALTRRYTSANDLRADLMRLDLPQPKLGEWLRSLFGEPAQIPAFKTAWTSDLPTVHTESIQPFDTASVPLPREGPSRILWIALPILVLSLGGAVVAMQREREPARARTSYSLEVTSTPMGAQIYLDGE